jgi:hypothetical protein
LPCLKFSAKLVITPRNQEDPPANDLTLLRAQCLVDLQVILKEYEPNGGKHGQPSPYACDALHKTMLADVQTVLDAYRPQLGDISFDDCSKKEIGAETAAAEEATGKVTRTKLSLAKAVAILDRAGSDRSTLLLNCGVSFKPGIAVPVTAAGEKAIYLAMHQARDAVRNSQLFSSSSRLGRVTDGTQLGPTEVHDFDEERAMEWYRHHDLTVECYTRT